MISHWRFDTFRICSTYFLSRGSHSSSWLRLSKVWSIDRDGRHETRTSATLEIFGLRGRPSDFRVRARWILYGDRVESGVECRNVLPTIGSSHRYRGCWRKWKKFPRRGPGIPMLKIYSTDIRYWFFVLPFTLGVFTNAFFLPSRLPLNLSDKKFGYVNEKVRFVGDISPMDADTCVYARLGYIALVKSLMLLYLMLL